MLLYKYKPWLMFDLIIGVAGRNVIFDLTRRSTCCQLPSVQSVRSVNSSWHRLHQGKQSSTPPLSNTFGAIAKVIPHVFWVWLSLNLIVDLFGFCFNLKNFQVFISRNHFRGWVAFSVGSGEENSLDWRLFFNLKFRMLAVSYLSTLITQATIEAGARTNGGRSAPCVRTWWLVRVCPDQWSPWEPVNRHGIASDNTNAKPR